MIPLLTQEAALLLVGLFVLVAFVPSGILSIFLKVRHNQYSWLMTILIPIGVSFMAMVVTSIIIGGFIGSLLRGENIFFVAFCMHLYLVATSMFYFTYSHIFTYPKTIYIALLHALFFSIGIMIFVFVPLLLL